MLGCLIFFVLLVLLGPVLLALFYFGLITVSFQQLGLTPQAAAVLFLASVVGSMINIPISRRPVVIEQPPRTAAVAGYFYYYPPRVQEQLLAINVGGAIIPVLFSLYLLPRAPLFPALATLVVVAAVSKALARPAPGVGITMPAFVPPLVAVSAALLLAPRELASPVAYIGGTIGTLIGADLLNLPAIHKMPGQMLSIGGAGVFDGVFLVGILSVLLT